MSNQPALQNLVNLAEDDDEQTKLSKLWKRAAAAFWEYQMDNKSDTAKEAGFLLLAMLNKMVLLGPEACGSQNHQFFWEAVQFYGFLAKDNKANFDDVLPMTKQAHGLGFEFGDLISQVYARDLESQGLAIWILSKHFDLRGFDPLHICERFLQERDLPPIILLELAILALEGLIFSNTDSIAEPPLPGVDLTPFFEMCDMTERIIEQGPQDKIGWIRRCGRFYSRLGVLHGHLIHFKEQGECYAKYKKIFGRFKNLQEFGFYFRHLDQDLSEFPFNFPSDAHGLAKLEAMWSETKRAFWIRQRDGKFNQYVRREELDMMFSAVIQNAQSLIRSPEACQIHEEASLYYLHLLENKANVERQLALISSRLPPNSSLYAMVKQILNRDKYASGMVMWHTCRLLSFKYDPLHICKVILEEKDLPVAVQLDLAELVLVALFTPRLMAKLLPHQPYFGKELPSSFLDDWLPFLMCCIDANATIKLPCLSLDMAPYLQLMEYIEQVIEREPLTHGEWLQKCGRAYFYMAGIRHIRSFKILNPTSLKLFRMAKLYEKQVQMLTGWEIYNDSNIFEEYSIE